MINSTAIRLYVVAAVVLATYGVACFVQAGLKLPDVEMPNWTFNELPLQLGEWQGHPTEMDPQIAVATGAKIIVNRSYQDGSGHSITMHTAVFDDPAGGVYHTPTNCYRTSGYQNTDSSSEELELPNDVMLPVKLTTWERKDERFLVIYWYQIGEYVLFDRWDLGIKIRWAFRGRPKWPALIKVLIQMAVTDTEEATPVILDFAKQVAAWENLPKHHLRMPDETNSSASRQSNDEKQP